MPYHSGRIQFDMIDSLLGITDVSNTVKSISGVPLIYWYYSYGDIHCKRQSLCEAGLGSSRECNEFMNSEPGSGERDIRETNACAIVPNSTRSSLPVPLCA